MSLDSLLMMRANAVAVISLVREKGAEGKVKMLKEGLKLMK